VSVEYDLDAGRRGERHGHAVASARGAGRAEDGVVTNNNAAAVLLALAALASRKEVIVARGELVEIGGGFRIPDVLRGRSKAGSKVGTTNRTYVRDYAAAITNGPARSCGCTRATSSSLGSSRGPEDRSLGSLAPRARRRVHPRSRQRDVHRHVALRSRPPRGDGARSIAAGADVVTFQRRTSCRRPQAGLAVRTWLRDPPLRAQTAHARDTTDKLTIGPGPRRSSSIATVRVRASCRCGG